VAKSKPKTTVEYTAMFPKDVQKILGNLRRVIRETAPEAVETISYDIPTFKLNGKGLISFGAWKKHVAIYPGTAAIEAFKNELSPYKQSKGTIQFPLDKPIPVDLVKKIVKFRIKENESEKKY
jgi:uncharacterized protein YdhG (YjbR/CyaY superfamily)